jgi:hypothetical protein
MAFADGMITPNGLHFERSHSGIPKSTPMPIGSSFTAL